MLCSLMTRGVTFASSGLSSLVSLQHVRTICINARCVTCYITGSRQLEVLYLSVLRSVSYFAVDTKITVILKCKSYLTMV